jgi:hypothetical protein
VYINEVQVGPGDFTGACQLREFLELSAYLDDWIIFIDEEDRRRVCKLLGGMPRLAGVAQSPPDNGP